MRNNPMGQTHRAVAAMPTRATTAPMATRVPAFGRSADGGRFTRATAEPDDEDLKDPDDSIPGEDGNTDDENDDRKDDDKENKPVQTQKARRSSVW